MLETMQKSILFLMLLSLCGFMAAQDTAPIPVTLNHISLSVTDANHSSVFYKQVLGLEEITNRTEAPGIHWFDLGSGEELHLIPGRSNDVKVNKSIHLAFSTPDLEKFTKKLDSQRIPWGDWPGTSGKIGTRADGVKQVYFQDPDGYWIEMNTSIKQ